MTNPVKNKSYLFVVIIILIALSVLTFSKRLENDKLSKIYLLYSGQVFNFKTRATTLGAAIAGQGISLAPQDNSSVPLNTKLSMSSLTVKIEKALPLLILDEQKRIVGKTLLNDPAKILAENNIKMAPEDVATLEQITDPVADGAVGQKLIIKRAPSFNVEFDGGIVEVKGWDNSVDAIVKKSKVVLGPKDEVAPNLNNTITPGTSVVITRINEVDVDVLADVSYDTTYRPDTSVAFGQKRVIQEGITGKIKKTYHVVYKNGAEVSRWLNSTETVTAKQNKIIGSGAVSGQSNWGPYYEDNYGPYTTAFHYSGYTGKYIIITNNANGKQVRVKIVDKGPDAALLDLSTTAFKELGGSISHGHIDSVSVMLAD